MFKIFSPTKLSAFFKSFKSFSSAGNLYTWGTIPAGTGFSDLSDSTAIQIPRLLGQFSSNVSKVSMGKWHSAVITSDGKLYTCGDCKKGELGHEDKNVYMGYEKVEFFKNKKVVDVVCDQNFTVALTEDGKLWRWGAIRAYDGLTSEDLNGVPDAETEEDTFSETNTPVNVAFFNGKKIVGLNAGTEFLTVFTEEGVFNWGRGRYGNFGNGYRTCLKTPAENVELKEFLQQNHLKIVKAKSSGYSTVMLLSNGKLYAMGDNWHGQLGVRKNVGIITDENVLDPTLVVEENLKGKKIVDFDLGASTLLILTDDNKVFFSGMRLTCKPTHWKLPENVKVTKLLASFETFGVVTSENKVIAFNENLMGNLEPDYNNRVYELPEDAFGKGEILEIGGRYNTRFAIVKN